ncbi:MAG TPA: hydrogenase maturation protease, partial [Anaerolineae bacterium]|nr:hydrogenase maturation protease [Anaerolineae bacterium]
FQGALSIHDAGLREALLLAEVLGVLPAEVIIYGVQPAHLDWGEGLSPAVEAALPELVNTIEERL